MKMGPLKTATSSSARKLAERYTPDTRRAIEFAWLEARSRGASEITVSDLLAGLSFEENSRAQRVGWLKKNAFYLRWLTGLPPLPAQAIAPEDRQPELGFDARKVLAFAVAEADRDREYFIDSDHVLRGLLRFPNQADFALLKTEMSLAAARIGSRKDREEILPDENPSLKVIEYLIGKHFALWGTPLLSAACYLYILAQFMGLAPFQFIR